MKTANEETHTRFEETLMLILFCIAYYAINVALYFLMANAGSGTLGFITAKAEDYTKNGCA